MVPKKVPGSARIAVDFTRLNTYVQRPIHPVPSPADVVAQVPATAKVFSALDASHGYCQVPLRESARHLTAFLTPWGRFRYRRGPPGLVSSGDEFNYRTDFAFNGVGCAEKIVDDLLVHSTDFSEHVADITHILDICRAYSITLSESKFQFAVSKVLFAGFSVSRGSGGRPLQDLSLIHI